MSSDPNNNTDIDSIIKNNVKLVKEKILATNQVFKLVRGAKSKMDDTCRKNQELEQQLAELRSALESSKEENVKLQEESQNNTAKEAQNNDYTTKINTLTTELNQAKSELNQKNMYVQQLEAKANELNQLCEQQKTDLSAGKAKEKHKQELTKKNNEIKSLQSKLQEAYTQVEQANKQVEDLKSENELLQEKANELEDENMVLKIEKDMDSMDEDDAKVESVNHTEELAALREELEQSKETSSALIATEKERAAKLDRLTKEMNKLKERNMELERAELKYQRELEDNNRRAHEPESSNTNYQELVRANEELIAENGRLHMLIDNQSQNNTSATARVSDLEEKNRCLQREFSNIKTKYQDLKSKMDSQFNSAGSPSTSSTSSTSRKSPKQVSHTTLKMMHNLKTELVQARLEKKLLMDFVMKEKLLKEKTLDELIVSSPSESGEGEEVQPNWEATSPPLLFDSFHPLSPVAPTSRQGSNASSPSSNSSTSKSPMSSVRSNSNASSSSSNHSNSPPARQTSTSNMTYTTSASNHTKNPTTASSLPPSSSSTSSVLPPTSAKGSMPPPATSPGRSNALGKSPATIGKSKISPPVAQRSSNYGSSGLIAPPPALAIAKPALKKRASNNKLVRFANSKNPGRLISSAALPAPMTPSELIRVNGDKVTIATQAVKRPLDEDDENQPPQPRSRMDTSPVATSPLSTSPAAVSPDATTTTSPTATSPAAERSTTPKSLASTSAATTPRSTTPTTAKPDSHTNKKRKVEAELLKSIEESLQTCTLIDLDQVTLKDIDKAFIELIESFSCMKSNILPEASPDSVFGIKDQFTIQAPNNFYKGEKEYAWYLSYLSTKDTFYNHIMTAIVGKIKFDVQCTKKEGVIARWFRLAALITRSRDDGDKMVSMLCDLAGTSGGKRFFCGCTLNVARAFPSCLKSSPTIPNVPRTLKDALAHVANYTGSENAASTYAKIAPALEWPALSEATPLKSLADENLALINDIVKLNTKTNKEEYENARKNLGRSLKIIFSLLNDWKYCYNSIIIGKLWPRLNEGDNTLTEVVVHLLGCLGSLGVSEDVLVEEKAGLEFLRNILTRLVEIEDEDLQSL